MASRPHADRLRLLTGTLRAFVEATSDWRSLLRTVVERTSLLLRAYCGVGLLSDEGPWLDLAGAYDPDPAALAALRSPWTDGRLRLDAQHPITRAIQAGSGALRRDFDAESFLQTLPPEHHAAARSLAIRSVLYAPLRARGRVIGVVTLIRHGVGAEPLDEDDRLVAESLADQAALAIEHARLVVRERATRETSERTEETLSRATGLLDSAHEASRLKSEFIANMSHELRTPLNAIIGFAALMHAGRAGPVSEVHHEYLGDILASSRHLLQLINDILDLSKLESGRMELRVEPVDLAATVGEVRAILRGLVADKRLRLSVELDPAVPTVVVDPRLLKQILYNLLSNAIKFTPEEGHVSLRVAAEGGRHFRVEVEDTGIGIRPEDMGRLFVEFQQLDADAARRYPGTGLGLALTKRIAEAQGGRVDARSTLGRGSTFSVVLPREVAPGPAPGAAA